MLRSFDSVALRQIRTRRLRSLLTTFGIVLGVGMVFGVLLLTGTVRSTFDDLYDSIYGGTDLVITSEDTAGGSIDPDVLGRVKQAPGVSAATGNIYSVFVLVGEDGEAVEGHKGKVNVAAFDEGSPDLGQIEVVEGRDVESGRELIVSRGWAQDNGIETGDSVPLATAGGIATFTVVGLLEYASGLAFGGQGIAEIPEAEGRRLMDKPRDFDELRVVAEDGADLGRLERRLEAGLGPGVRVETPEGLGEETADQLEALNVVLYFFSGIALFVGAFLILNAFNMTVLQRMREIGMLRTLGATRGMVVRSVLAEALVLGAIGSVIGLGVGVGLALGLVALMRGLGLPVNELTFSPSAVVAAIACGLLATAAGALYPARRAARVQPIRAVLGTGESRSRPGPARAVAGLLLFLPGLLLGGLFWFGTLNPGGFLGAVGGIGLTMAMFLGLAIAAPFLVMPVIGAATAPLRRLFPAGLRLASDSLRANPGRTSATAATLMIGLSVVVVNGTMSASFLGTVRDQIDRAFARDVTVQGVGFGQGGPEQTVPPEVVRRLREIPQAGVVTTVKPVYAYELPALKRGDTAGLIIGLDPERYPKVDEGETGGVSREQAYAELARGGVLLGPAYADLAGLERGDKLTLAGPAGKRTVPVVGTAEGSSTYFGGRFLQVSFDTLRSVYGRVADLQVLVKARDPAQREELERAAEAVTVRDFPNLEVLSTAEVKDDFERQINQQFGLFNSIVAIAVIVSLLGIINTLAMSVIERTREIGLLRALGSTRWQVRRTMLDESVLITFAGSVLGIAVGALIGWVWVLGIGSTFEGISFVFPTRTAVAVGLAGMLLGVAAAILPARRAARLKVIEALNYE